MEISIKEIKRPASPDINDELAKQVGYDTLGELREFLSKRLEVEKKNQVEGEMHEQIYSKLIEMADFDLPGDMIAHQSNERLHRYQMELINKGTPMEEMEKNIDDLKNASEVAAKIMRGETVEEEKPEVTPEEPTTTEQEKSDG